MDKENTPINKVKEIIAMVSGPEKSEHTDGGEPSWIKLVAMLTGVLAALAGFLTVRSTVLTNEAIYESNQAILSQTQASDAWTEYQADSIKARVIETQLLPSFPIAAQDKAELAKDDEAIRGRQPKSKQLAEGKEKERDAHMGNGLKRLEEKDLLGYAGMAVQLAIALASVAALVKIRGVFLISIAVGTIGIAVTAYVFLVH